MRIKRLLCLMLMNAAFLLLTNAYADDLSKDIFVSNAWIEALPSVQRTTAAYFTITNNSKREVVMVSVSSDIAGAVEIHQMSEMNGMMSMKMLSKLHIPAMSKVTLRSGGYHIMLIDLKKPLMKGDIIPISLHFQGGGTIIVKAQVKGQVTEEDSSMPGMKM